MLKVRISIGFSSMVNGGDSFSTGFLGLPAATTIKVNTLGATEVFFHICKYITSMNILVNEY